MVRLSVRLQRVLAQTCCGDCEAVAPNEKGLVVEWCDALGQYSKTCFPTLRTI